MASNFAFVPMGLTSNVTATAGTSTVTLSMNPSISTSSSKYYPDGVRLANPGTVAVFVQFAPATATVGLSTGMPLFGNTVETFQLKGQLSMAFTSVGTATVYITLGEGL